MEKSNVIGKVKPLYSQFNFSYITGFINLLCKLVVRLENSKYEILRQNGIYQKNDNV